MEYSSPCSLKYQWFRKGGDNFFTNSCLAVSQKRQHPYPVVMGWLKCWLSFPSFRASIMCIQGSRSSFRYPVYASNISPAQPERWVPPYKSLWTLWPFVYSYLVLFFISLFELLFNIFSLKKSSQYVYKICNYVRFITFQNSHFNCPFAVHTFWQILLRFCHIWHSIYSALVTRLSMYSIIHQNWVHVLITHIQC